MIGAGANPDPMAFYRNEVIRVPGALMEVANGCTDFEVMERELLREIIDGAPSMRRVDASDDRF